MDINRQARAAFNPMIYGSSYSSSSSSASPAGVRPSSTAEDVDNERHPLLQYENQNLWTPREPKSTELGVLNPPDSYSLPAAGFDRELEGKMTIGKFLKKLETDHEPGLSDTQLMLINHDLKPGMALKFFS